MGVNIYIIDVNTSEAVHIQLVLRSFILLCIYLFSLPYNVEVVVPNWPILGATAGLPTPLTIIRIFVLISPKSGCGLQLMIYILSPLQPFC